MRMHHYYCYCKRIMMMIMNRMRIIRRIYVHEGVREEGMMVLEVAGKE